MSRRMLDMTTRRRPPDIARRYLQVLVAGAGWVVENIFSVLLGFNAKPSSVPLVGIALRDPGVAWGIAGVFAALTLIALIAYMGRKTDASLDRKQRLAQIYLRIVGAVLYLIVGGIFSILLGFSSFSSTAPFLNLIKQHPTEAILVGMALLGMTVLALFIHPRLEPEPQPAHGSSWRIPRAWVSLATSTVSCLLFAGLLLTVLLRPSWCPVAICPAPVAVTVSTGIHDANVDAYFTTFQTAALELSQAPTSYTLGNLPRSSDPRIIGAVRIDQVNFPIYRVVLGVHSLQHGHFGVIIERVALLVHTVAVPPHPLDVWLAGSPLDYHSNPYRVIYSGEPAGAVLPATYEPVPLGYVQLSPGESDELDVQVTAPMAVDLRFKIQLTYRVTNESALHTLILPQIFEVVFAQTPNWHEYVIPGGTPAATP